MSRKAPIRLALVDDHPMVLEGLSSLLSQSGEFTITAKARSGKEALALLSDHNIDVILLDNRLPDINGIQICREIMSLHPDVKIIILTSHLDDDAIMDSIHAGAHGYLLKEVDVDELTDAIHSVRAGESAMPTRVTQQLIQSIRNVEENREDTQRKSLISPQEERVMALVAEGLINKEIATEMNLSDKTVKNYLSNIFVKLNIQRRSQVASFYTKNYKSERNER